MLKELESTCYTQYLKNHCTKLYDCCGKKKLVDLSRIASLARFINVDDLNKVEVKSSTVHGHGVFAKVNIKQGELVTLYPADVVKYDFEVSEHDFKEKDYLVLAHCSDRFGQKLKDKTDQSEMISKFDFNYAYEIDDTLTIMGDSECIEPNSYIGHIINDGAKHNLLFNMMNDVKKSTKEAIETYIKESTALTNCKFYDFEGKTHVGILATRDIKVGEELFISYGVSYWLMHNEKKNTLRVKK